MRAWLAAWLLLAAPVGAADATYRLSGEHLPSSVTRNGYHQVVTPIGEREVLVQVATEPRPVGAAGQFVLAAARHPVPDGFVLPSALAGSLEREDDPWRAATAVLAWVGRHLRVWPDDPAPQDAAAVLARGGGRCSGLANATAALLLTAGLPARTVSGLLVGDDGAVPHRWVECELPGAGWVPTDPTLGLWVLTPRHLAFDRPVLELPQVEIVQQGDDGLDGLPNHGGHPLRPNHGAALTCHLAPALAGTRVELRGPAGALRWGSGQGRLRFADLLPGRWVIALETDGEPLQVVVRLGDSEHASIALPPPRRP